MKDKALMTSIGHVPTAWVFEIVQLYMIVMVFAPEIGRELIVLEAVWEGFPKTVSLVKQEKNFAGLLVHFNLGFKNNFNDIGPWIAQNRWCQNRYKPFQMGS